MTFVDYVTDRVRVCDHCGMTMMRSDYRGPCNGQLHEPKLVVPSFEEWQHEYQNYMVRMESENGTNNTLR